MLLSEEKSLRIQAENILPNSEELIRLILDSASEAICGCDSEGTCLFSNPSAARILGYDDPAELLGKNMHALEHHTRKDGTPYPIEEYGELLDRLQIATDRALGVVAPLEFFQHPLA